MVKAPNSDRMWVPGAEREGQSSAAPPHFGAWLTPASDLGLLVPWGSGVPLELFPSRHPGTRSCGCPGNSPGAWGGKGTVPKCNIPSCPLPHPCTCHDPGQTPPQTTSSCGGCGRKSVSGWTLGPFEGWAGPSQQVQLQLRPTQACFPPPP